MIGYVEDASVGSFQPPLRLLLRIWITANRGHPMEDEGFVDDDFIEDTAREYIARFGSYGVSMLQERAEIAEAAGDYLSAQTWREMIEAAERLVSF